jgi:hypothetical protein
MINFIKYSAKTFINIETLKPFFNKSLTTLDKLMDEVGLGYLFDRISLKMVDITTENTMKLLIRCKLMLSCRN